MMPRTAAAALLVWLAAAASAAQEPPPRRAMTAARIADGESIAVDGRLDEPVWARAVPATDFIQQDPRNGSPPSEQTEVRIAFSGTAIYMGVTCHDSEPDRMLRFQRRRDEFLPSDDRFMWVIDPFLSAQNGYFFETNPSGLMGDALISPAGQNRQWDGIWTLRVHRGDAGWSFEVEIPFSTLNFDPEQTDWGVNFQRTVRRRNEESLWNGWARNQGLQRLPNAGLLRGISNVSQGLGLELRPYGLVTSESTGEAGAARRTEGKAGVDLSYSVTPSLRANLTLNTDFAQTEVDQRLVNLTRFPLFFPEKRTFFLEGANLFDFVTTSNPAGQFAGSPGADNSLVPFFSRTIGLDANGEPRAIDYGAKLIGQIGRQDVGVLHVRTADETGAPGQDFTVVRAKRRLLRQSYVAGLFTQASASSLFPDWRRTIGADMVLSTSTFRGAKNLSASAFFLKATDVAGSGRNAAFGARADYPNDRWNAGIAYRGIQEDFDPAVGFLLRSGYQRYTPYVNFSPRPANHRYIRRLGFTAGGDLQSDMRNRLLSRALNLTLLAVDLHTQDAFNVMVIPQYERLDRDFEIYPGVTLANGREFDFVRYRATIATANRRVVALIPSIEWGDFYSGTRRQVNLDVTLRARPGVIVYLGSELNQVNLPEGRFTTRLFRATPELQFSQWVSAVNTFQYDSISRVLGWQSRFRWIVTPGSDLYVVYTHNWRENPSVERFATLNHRAATKLVYTQRF